MGYTVGRTIATNKENSSHVPRPSFGLYINTFSPTRSSSLSLFLSLALSGPITQFKRSQTPSSSVCLER